MNIDFLMAVNYNSLGYAEKQEYSVCVLVIVRNKFHGNSLDVSHMHGKMRELYFGWMCTAKIYFIFFAHLFSCGVHFLYGFIHL